MKCHGNYDHHSRRHMKTLRKTKMRNKRTNAMKSESERVTVVEWIATRKKWEMEMDRERKKKISGRR